MSWLTAEEALAALGTKPQSLYASVSRGRIRARPDPTEPRRSQYDRDDVERLARRAAGRRRAETVAADAIRWGDPVLTSSISTIIDGRPYYRGRDAVALADTASLEEVAGLLWRSERAEFISPHPPGIRAGAPLETAFLAIAARAGSDVAAPEPESKGVAAEASAIVGMLAMALTGEGGGTPLHRRIAAAWRRPEAAGLIRQALVLLADHELNPSTFAARIAASTGAPLSAAVLAGLATLVGPSHGGAPRMVAQLVTETDRRGPAAATGSWSGRQGHLAGFGHPLYPGGDPRAAVLLAGFPLPPAFARFAAIARELTGEVPNVDFALAALSAAFDLPPDAPLQLFLLARSVGWLAHAMEQIATGGQIRPRANYVGPAPGLS